jgi:type II secretory pathway predicted ATPase ExeA
MYENFFGLQRRPFSATPDASCFVPLEAHQGVLDALAVSCERGQGIGVLTGEAGLGKSLVGLRLAFELQPMFATAFLGHSAYATRRALLQAILYELNQPFDRKAEQELRLELASALKSLRPEKQGFVLIVDEAHRLSLPLLDELRLLTLLAEAGEPLARVVLIGDRHLEERLAHPELAAFNQRVCCQVDLAPLTQVESLEYLSAQLESSGGDAEEIFTEEAMAFLAKAADGVPRCLNHLADHALLLAYVNERRPVSAETVREALDDLKQLPLHWNDPLTGGEIYRGLSQRPAMEDSAVDLWPQQELPVEQEPSEANSWNDAKFSGSSTAIEIGGELEEPTTDRHDQPKIEANQITCLKENRQAIAHQSAAEDLPTNVIELTQSIEDRQDPPTLGQIFGAREYEFGSPSPRSFAVEEFAAEERDSDFDREPNDDHWTPQDNDESVWNLPERSWSVDDDRHVEFEEEPVIDRYVRIASDEGVVWNHHVTPVRTAAQPTVTAVKTTRLVMAAAGVDDESNGPNRTPVSYESHSPETDSSIGDSGIVESYSRKPRDVGQDFNLPVQKPEPPASDDHRQVENLPHEKRDWHLPTELLQATLADDGIEEQIGADVLDMYLDMQQPLLDQRLASERSTVDELPPIVDEFPSETNDESHKPLESQSVTKPDAIQRAYGRLFSELRRRKK